MHVGVGQSLRPIITYSRIGDDPAGRVEPVHIKTEEEAISGTWLVVQTGREHQIVALSGFGAEIRV